MPRLVRSLLCKRIITDRESNDVTFIDCVEQLAPKQLPAPLPRLFLATLWKSDEDEQAAPELRVTFIGPNRRKVFSQEFPPIEIEPKHSSHRVNIDLQGAPVKAYGEHSVRIEVRSGGAMRWTKVADLPLEIVEPPPQSDA